MSKRRNESKHYESVSRMRMVRRLAALMRLALTRRYMPPVVDLAREHGVCERTIRRDLGAIESVVPIRWRQNEAA